MNFDPRVDTDVALVRLLLEVCENVIPAYEKKLKKPNERKREQIQEALRHCIKARDEYSWFMKAAREWKALPHINKDNLK